MKRCPIRLAVLIVAVALASDLAISPAFADQPAFAHQIERGRSLFKSKGCYECHGYVGQGAIATGPALSPSALPLDAVQAYVRNPAGQMPPYGAALLTDGDIEAIVSFLQSLPKPPDPASIPLLAPYIADKGSQR